MVPTGIGYSLNFVTENFFNLINKSVKKTYFYESDTIKIVPKWIKLISEPEIILKQNI